MVEINVGDVFARIDGNRDSDFYSFRVLAVDDTGEAAPEAWIYWNGAHREDLTLKYIHQHFIKVVPTFEIGKTYQWDTPSGCRYMCHRLEEFDGSLYVTMRRAARLDVPSRLVTFPASDFSFFKEVEDVA